MIRCNQQTLSQSKIRRAPRDEKVTLPVSHEHVSRAAAPTHFLSVDVESAHQASNLSSYFSNDQHLAQAQDLQGRLKDNLKTLLHLFHENDVKATFFVCASMVDEIREQLDEICSSGHQLANHGFAHENLHHISFECWQADLEKSTALLQEWLPEEGTRAYRAPDFSLPCWNPKYYQSLMDFGYSVSSSVMAARIPHAGWQELTAEKRSALLAGESFETVSGDVCIREFPLPSFRLLGMPFAFGGGFWLRALPFIWNQTLIRRQQRLGRSFHLYMHPWEVDPGQKKLPIHFMRRFRQYAGVAGFADRIERLLGEYNFRVIS